MTEMPPLLLQVLEEASRLYFGEHNAGAMLDQLLPLHQEIEAAVEVSFMEDVFKQV